jgi:hypothetical protein
MCASCLGVAVIGPCFCLWIIHQLGHDDVDRCDRSKCRQVPLQWLLGSAYYALLLSSAAMPVLVGKGLRQNVELSQLLNQLSPCCHICVVLLLVRCATGTCSAYYRFNVLPKDILCTRRERC